MRYRVELWFVDIAEPGFRFHSEWDGREMALGILDGLRRSGARARVLEVPGEKILKEANNGEYV